jgi:tRNA nucleotidyltransferase/poly(A) polymerase
MSSQEINTPLFWLQEAGFSAYFVGNQVRNRLLDINSDSKDVDIATDATPADIARMLRNHNIIPGTIDEKFGVVAFRFNEVLYEITTFRKDIYSEDLAHVKRYPETVQFVQVAAQDAERRDLTINAIYLNPKTGKYLDYVGGLDDIKHKIIRVVGDPATRFQEDPLRILRAVRFKHELGFKYDAKTLAALKKHGFLVKKLSPGVLKKEYLKIQALPDYHKAKLELQQLGLVLRA